MLVYAGIGFDTYPVVLENAVVMGRVKYVTKKIES